MLYDVISKCIACSRLQRCGIKLLEKYHLLTYIHQSRKKSTTRDRHRKKNQERSITSTCNICFCGLDFPRKTRSVTLPKIAYTCIFVLSGIFSLILAYAILNKHHDIAGLYKIAQLTHIRTYHFIFLVPTVTSLAMLLDVFSRNCTR